MLPNKPELWIVVTSVVHKDSEENGWHWKAEASEGSYEQAVAVNPLYVAGLGPGRSCYGLRVCMLFY